jgi:hypothetical protein
MRVRVLVTDDEGDEHEMFILDSEDGIDLTVHGHRLGESARVNADGRRVWGAGTVVIAWGKRHEG